jgi:hypothetical protein
MGRDATSNESSILIYSILTFALNYFASRVDFMSGKLVALCCIIEAL